ncbi:MAG: response regulator [Gammaproteobacteria bacterium]|nr:response regulator [Gammaproteobacteria bacterium]
MSHAATRLLIVDDDDVLTHTLKRILAPAYREIWIRDTVSGALDLALEQRPEHALVDLRLGDENGLELVEALVAIDAEMRIVVLSGYGTIPTCVQAMRLGAFDFVCKPATRAEILRAFEDRIQPAQDVPATLPSLRQRESDYLQHVLELNDGNVSATARALRMHRRTLQRKLAKRRSVD